MPQKIFTATTAQWSPDLSQDLEKWKGWHQCNCYDLEVRSSDLMGHLWKCKQLEIEEMAVCLSVGPGQGGSWIKAFQQIVSIISLLLLPLPTFFTIPAPARFLLRVSLHLVAAPTVALFQMTPVWEISSSCSWIWNGLPMTFNNPSHIRNGARTTFSARWIFLQVVMKCQRQATTLQF